MTTQFQELLSQPFFPWFILAILAVGWGLSQVDRHVPDDPIELFKKKLGISNWPHILVLVPILAWLTLFSLLSWGLCTVIADIAWNVAQPQKLEEQGNFRFLLTKTAALTAVLGAMVALPFTIYRLKLTTEQNRHNADVLYNDKLHEANSDLHAMRQITVPVLDKNGKETHKRETIWQDDIIRRNGAIERLRSLAEEAADNGQLKNADTIHRLLQTYFQEMPSAKTTEQSKSANEEKLPVEKEKTPADLRPDIKSAGLALARLKSPEFSNKIVRNAINRSPNGLQEAIKRASESFAGAEFAKLEEAIKRASEPLAGAEFAKLQEAIKRASESLAGAEFAKLEEAIKRASEPSMGLEEALKRLGQQSLGSKKGDDDAK